MKTGHNTQPTNYKNRFTVIKLIKNTNKKINYRAAKRCITKPKTVAVNKTHNSLYLAVTPDWRSDSIFPGSKYAIDIKNPGPVNAHSLRKLNPSCWSRVNIFLTSAEYLNRNLDSGFNLLFLELVSFRRQSTCLNAHLVRYFHLAFVHFVN